ncbi:MAG: orotate phosphoribosyltransferase [Planctomycetota bacterium]
MSTLTVYNKSSLIELIHRHALELGDFTLASGEQAHFYLDCRKLTLTGEGANMIASGMLELMRTDWPDAVGGMAIGADPITASIVTCAWQQQKELRGFIVRKEQKEHGTGRQVEGPVQPGDRAVIVEDVVTTGGSSIKAIKYARQFGLEIDRIIAIVDRQQGASERFAEIDVQLESLVRLDELDIPDKRG